MKLFILRYCLILFLGMPFLVLAQNADSAKVNTEQPVGEEEQAAAGKASQSTDNSGQATAANKTKNKNPNVGGQIEEDIQEIAVFTFYTILDF